MSAASKIEWTGATWNPTTGCVKVSPGCKNCYAKRDWVRLSANPKTVYFNRRFEDVRVHADRLDAPLRWTKPRRVFVNSMSDLFHADERGLEATPVTMIEGVSVYNEAMIERMGTRGFVCGAFHGTEFVRVGKKIAGRVLDGRTHDEFPA